MNSVGPIIQQKLDEISHDASHGGFLMRFIFVMKLIYSSYKVNASFCFGASFRINARITLLRREVSLLCEE